jgi:hypothetical protein
VRVIEVRVIEVRGYARIGRDITCLNIGTLLNQEVCCGRVPALACPVQRCPPERVRPVHLSVCVLCVYIVCVLIN